MLQCLHSQRLVSFRMKYPPKILKNPEVLMLQYQGTFDQRQDGWHSSEYRKYRRVQQMLKGQMSAGFLLVQVGASLSRIGRAGPSCHRWLGSRCLLCGCYTGKQCTMRYTLGWQIDICVRVFWYWSHVVLGLRSVPWQTERDVSITQR